MSVRRISVYIAILGALTAVACSGAATPAAQPTAAATDADEPTAEATQSLAEIKEDLKPDPNIPTLEFPPTSTPAPVTDTDDVPAIFSQSWDTDFSKHSVAFSEIRSGGPPRDGIPPIDDPQFTGVADAPDYMNDQEPVIALEIDGAARAYPLAILMWHEIVNDEVGGVPVTVTYCPLCNTAIVFDRRVGDRLLDFGTSGLLRNSDLVMWDRQTESWWQQITGEAIVGELTGTKLTFLPAPLVSWKDFATSFPSGEVLTRDTGYSRTYNRPPYSGYDDLDNKPFLFSGQPDPRLMAMERVVGLTIDGENVAYPFALFQERPVVNDAVGGRDVAIFYSGGTFSAFASGGFGNTDRREVGSTGVYDPMVNGEKLTFSIQGDAVVDDQTGTTWGLLGQALEGELAGTQLTPLVHANHFWFAWAAFHPDTVIREASELAG